MDVSKKNTPDGEQLIDEVVTLTGLPAPSVKKELDSILELAGHAPQNLTIDELRLAMVAYLEEIHAEMMAEHGDSGEFSSDEDAEDAMIDQPISLK